MLSGQDLPLKNPSEIHEFFDRHINMEFIDMSIAGKKGEFIDRIKYYYPLKFMYIKANGFSTCARKICRFVQKCVGINRIKNLNVVFGYGCNWFSISDKLANFILMKKDFVEKTFKRGFCADELFVQTIYNMMPSDTRNPLYKKMNHPTYKYNYSVVRAIDWTRGLPYVWKDDDFDELMASECLFARKFDSNIDGEIINRIAKSICNS